MALGRARPYGEAVPEQDPVPSVTQRDPRRPRPAVDLSARLGLVMKRLRADQGLSQEALADLADLDRTYVSSLERGMNRATLEVVGLLAEAFGLTILELMTLVEQQHRPKERPRRTG